MPRFLVERTFPDRFLLEADPESPVLGAVAACNAAQRVHWIHSFVSADRTKTFCIYDAESPDAIRAAATAAGLPVDGITEVRVLDPAFYVGPSEAAVRTRS